MAAAPACYGALAACRRARGVRNVQEILALPLWQPYRRLVRYESAGSAAALPVQGYSRWKIWNVLKL